MHSSKLRQIMRLHADVALERGPFSKAEVIDEILSDPRCNEAVFSMRDVYDMRRSWLGAELTELLKMPIPDRVASLMQQHHPEIMSQFEFIPTAICIRGGADPKWIASWKAAPEQMQQAGRQREDLVVAVQAAADQLNDLAQAVKSKGLSSLESAWTQVAATPVTDVTEREGEMADRLPRQYRFQYRLTFFAGHWKHSYELVGRWGGLHFHVTDMGEDHAGPDRYSAGLEVHYRQPSHYMAEDPPSHDECWLLKAPCWHDGTSMYAHEVLLPPFDGMDHVRIFQRLAADADERFAEFSTTHPAAAE